jgi:glycosyltransferase involved in cell wall biosynthesis
MTNFSVLMSVYNKEIPEYLNQCLESLALQTSPATEIIIVKDGILGEELDKVLSLWQDKLPLKLAGYGQNKGLAYALNYGLQFCSCEFVTRMDSDDICVCSRFEKQLGFLELNPDVALLSGYISEFKSDPDNIYNIRKVPIDSNKIAKYLKWRNAFNHMTVFFKKSAVLSVGGYNSNVTYFEDYDLWIRLVQAGYKVGNIPEVLVNARIGNDMIGRRHGLAYAKKELDFLGLQKKRGFISGSEYCLLVLLRVPPRLLPKIMLNCIYQLLRHRKVKVTQ